MPKSLDATQCFLAPPEEHLADYNNSKVCIQLLPYEYTSSYHEGSKHGPMAMINASHYVEFFDEETGLEAYKETGVCTLQPTNFEGVINERAVGLIYEQTAQLLEDNKFVISLGAEHTISSGIIKAFKNQYSSISVLQIDAHSDLRDAYEGNPYSHASVMARVHDMNVPMVQVGIRAQCREEHELYQSSDIITTYFDYTIHDNDDWIDECIAHLSDIVYVTIDADGFNPSVAPAVGTAEPGGLTWHQGLKLLKKLSESKKVVGFDIVEIAPRSQDTITEFTMAKLCYKFLGYLHQNNQIL